MWAGGRLKFFAPLPVGTEAQRVSQIKAVESKQGKSGPLVFVTVAHEISVRGTLVIQEEHDIVYRGTQYRALPESRAYPVLRSHGPRSQRLRAPIYPAWIQQP